MESQFMELRQVIRDLKGNLVVDKTGLAQFRIVLFEAVDLYNSVADVQLTITENKD